MLDYDIQANSIKDVIDKIINNPLIKIRINRNQIELIRLRRIYGYIIDDETAEPLIYAHVFDPLTKKGTSSNEYGFFSFTTDYTVKEIHASYLGHEKKKLIINDRNEAITIRLINKSFVEEIIVRQGTNKIDEHYYRLGKENNILQNQLGSLHAVGGEPDLYQAVLKESGVTSGPDGFGGLHVRGGSNDQNLILYDGVPVYNAGHALGLVSIFNPHAINNANISKDFFSSSEGGRLSSIIDVRMKEGNKEKISGLISLSTIASQFIIEGPILKNKTAFMLSMRRSHIDPLFKQRSRDEKAKVFLTGESNYYFYDINAKIHHEFSRKDQVYLSYYKGRDRYQNQDILDEDYIDGYTFLNNEFKVAWGNQFTSLRWNHLFSDQVFAKLNLTQSIFEYRSNNYYYLEDFYSESNELIQDIYATDFSNKIKDLGARIDFDYFPNDTHKIIFGSSLSRKTITPGAISINQETYSGELESDVIFEYIDEEFEALNYQSLEWGIYGQDKWRLSSRLSFIFGIRWNLFQTSDPESATSHSYQALQPRAMISYSLSEKARIFSAYNRMYQGLHILNTNDIGFPNELWVPSSQNIKPSSADQWSLGVRYETSNTFKLDCSIYYKRMNGLTNFGDEAFVPSLTEYSPDFWTETVALGKGKSLGIELQNKIKTDRTTLRINYSYSKTQRKFDFINDNQWYDYSFDQNHVIDLGYQLRLNKAFSITTQWQFASGLAQTLVSSPWKIQVLDNLSYQEGELLSDINDYRLPSYHRLNISLNFSWRWGNFKNGLSLGVQNIYNNQNVYYAYEVIDEDFPEFNESIEQKALPILPSLNYVLKF